MLCFVEINADVAQVTPPLNCCQASVPAVCAYALLTLIAYDSSSSSSSCMTLSMRLLMAAKAKAKAKATDSVMIKDGSIGVGGRAAVMGCYGCFYVCGVERAFGVMRYLDSGHLLQWLSD